MSNARYLGFTTAGLSLAAGAYFLMSQAPPLSWVLAGTFGLIGGYATATSLRTSHRPIVRLKGLTWTREDFCRGWLITGDTGSGKTRSGITPLLYQVFQNEPRWGGLCIDDKGIYWETLSEMARHFNRQNDLILLQVRPDNAPLSWKPTHTYNLTSDTGIPYSTFAKFVVDTVLSLLQRDELVLTRASSGEITVLKSELIKLIGKRRWHMVKPKRQYTLSAITGLARRLNQGERNAYLTASEVVEHEFEELVQLKRQLDRLPPTFVSQPTGSSNTNVTFGLDHSVWEIQTRLLKLRASEIILCRAIHRKRIRGHSAIPSGFSVCRGEREYSDSMERH